MNFHIPHQNLSAGILGGTLLSSIENIGSQNVITTVILAILGATVSFIVSVMMKKLLKCARKKRRK
jgi:hypothetical protein